MKQPLVFLVIALLSIGAFAVYRFPEVNILSVELVNGKIEVVKSQYRYSTYTVTNTPLVIGQSITLQGDFSHLVSGNRVWKEIYAAKDGQIVLEKIIEAKVVPAQDERYEFPK